MVIFVPFYRHPLSFTQVTEPPGPRAPSMADLPGMARLADPRGYECVALGCPGHSKRFTGKNFKQDATRHSQTPRHAKAHAGEPPEKLEGIRVDTDAKTGDRTYRCLVCPAKTVFAGASATGNVRAHVKGPVHQAALQGKTHVPKRPEHYVCGLCGGLGHNETVCTLKPRRERGGCRTHRCSVCKAEGHHATSCSFNKKTLAAFRTCADVVELWQRVKAKDFVTPLSIGVQYHDWLPLERDACLPMPLHEEKSRAAIWDRHVAEKATNLVFMAMKKQRAMRSARRRVPPWFGPDADKAPEISVYTMTVKLAEHLDKTFGTFQARQAYRDEVKAELFKSVNLLSVDEQTALWALPTTKCRSSRQDTPKSMRCEKYYLHLLRDRATYAIVQKNVRAAKIREHGGLREGCLSRPSVETLSTMYARADRGKQAEEELIASEEAFQASIQAKQLELNCHHVIYPFEHLMLPAKMEVIRGEDPKTDIFVADSDGESDVPGSEQWHECKLCGLRKPCVGNDCMLCVQAACFRDMRKPAAPVLAPVSSLLPDPAPKKRRILL